MNFLQSFSYLRALPAGAIQLSQKYFSAGPTSGLAQSQFRAVATPSASLAHLAKTLNLSVSTVSRALRDHAHTNAATKKRVLALAAELGYQPNHLAAGLRTGRSNLLGVLVPHIRGTFFPLVVDGIETAARRAGYHVLICQSNDDVEHERKNIDTLLNAQVEGILVSLSRTTHTFEHFAKVRKRGIPLVFFDRMMDVPETSAVLIDDFQAAYQLVQHLAQQGKRRIAHFVGPQHLNVYRNRYEGYRAGLSRCQLPADERLVVPGNMRQQDGIEGMQQLLDLPPAARPDAVLSASDWSAVGALQVLKERCLRVPEDVALTGFSNENFTQLTEPRLTSVDQRGEEMGLSAVRLFLDMLAAPAGEFLPRRLVLQPGILIRESSQAAPPAVATA